MKAARSTSSSRTMAAGSTRSASGRRPSLEASLPPTGRWTRHLLKFCVESGTVNQEFRRVTLDAVFREGKWLSGRAWRQRDLVFVPALGELTDCCRAPVAQRAGVRSGIAFPVMVRGQVIGTMDFFALETLRPSPERLEALGHVGRIVSATVERLENFDRGELITTVSDNVNHMTRSAQELTSLS